MSFFLNVSAASVTFLSTSDINILFPSMIPVNMTEECILLCNTVQEDLFIKSYKKRKKLHLLKSSNISDRLHLHLTTFIAKISYIGISNHKIFCSTALEI